MSLLLLKRVKNYSTFCFQSLQEHDDCIGCILDDAHRYKCGRFVELLLNMCWIEIPKTSASIFDRELSRMSFVDQLTEDIVA
jgi:hypothetical protein